MTSPASRAGALAAIGLLSVLGPVIGAGTALLFAAIALLVLATPQDSRVFDQLATVADRQTGQLRTLAGFILAVAVLALLGTVDAFGLSATTFAMTVLIVAFGHTGETLVRTRGANAFTKTAAFAVVGAIAALTGYLLLRELPPVEPTVGLSLAVFLAAVGALAAGLYRTELDQEDPLEVVAVGLLLWFFAGIGIDLSPGHTLLVIVVTAGLGVLAYVTETASVPGMVSGVLLALITFVLGGFAWFALLVAFFVLGGLATKYRYEEKAARGVAESEQGSRGTANVLSNGLVPLVILVSWAAIEAFEVTAIERPEEVFGLAFGGAVATALADTLSSEIGSLQDEPRLITSFEPVRAGTDGAITMLGTTAGGIGSALIAGMGYVLLPEITLAGAVFVFIAGVGGTFADSIFGATLEGRLVGNDGVNLLATLVGALLASGMLIITTAVG